MEIQALKLLITEPEINQVAARETAGKYGVAIDRTRLKLDMVGDRALRVSLKVDVRIGTLLPAGLHFKARMDVDDQLNGKITRPHIESSSSTVRGRTMSTCPFCQ